MANILSDAKKQQVIALGQLGWTLRRIEGARGVRRETAGAYLKAAGLAVRPPGRWGHPPANPAKAVSTDPGPITPGLADRPPWPPRPSRAPTASACAPYRELIELALARGRNAMAIWRDLVDDHGFPAQYASVRRFVVTLRGPRTPEAHPVIVTAPGEEAQVDYGDGPMVRHPGTGKYRRARLFLFTLGYSRKSVRHRPYSGCAQGAALRESRRRPGVPRSLGCSLGRHPHPRHDQASGRRDVRRGAAHAPAAARRAVSLLPVRHPHRPSRRLCRGRLRVLRSEERRVGKECRSRWSPYH